MPAQWFSPGRLVVGILTLLLFFMPWMEVSCGGHRFMTLSGYQMAAGFKVPNPRAAANLFRKESDRQPATQRSNAAPMLWTVPLAALALAVVGLLRVRSGRGSLPLGLVSLLAAAICLLKMILENQAFSEKVGEGGGMVELLWQPAYWATLLAFLGWGLAECLLSRRPRSSD